MAGSSRVRKCVFPVGGLGTRFLPATKAIPKEMLPVVDRPLIQYAVEEARRAGIEEFIFVTGRGKAAIEDHFDRSWELEAMLQSRGRVEELEALRASLPEPGQIAYTRQQAPLGLGHAVWCARHLVGDEPFAVILADDLVLAQTPALGQMMARHEQMGGQGNMVAIIDVPRRDTARYGILDVTSDDGTLVAAKGLVEKPAPDVAPSTVSIIGRYLLQPSVFTELERQERGAGGEVQLTDAIARTLPSVPLHGFRFEGERFDCGTQPGFLRATVAHALARPEMRVHMQQIIQTYQATELTEASDAGESIPQ
ncbi:MAG: UTP--glucose-1-phosphate uridylyltransferase [Nannocystaceae bacterium]